MKRKYEIAIIALIVLNIFTLSELNNLQNLINNKYINLINAVESTDSRVSSITANISTMLEKQSTILDSYEILFGDNLNSDLTVPVTVSVTPKEYTEGLKANLIINEESVSMQKNAASFFVTTNINIFENFQPKVILEQNGVQKIESIEQYVDLYQDYLLQIYGRYLGHKSYLNNKCILKGEIEIEVYSKHKNFAERATIFYDLNGEIIKEYQVEVPKIENSEYDKNNFIYSNIDETIDLYPNDKLTIYALVDDSNGLTYKTILDVIEIDQDGKKVYNTARHTMETVIEIRDKNNNLLNVPKYFY